MRALAQVAPDGVRDFDWEIGTWQTHVRVRAPLSTEDAWTEFRGASVVHAISEGRANMVELDVADRIRLRWATTDEELAAAIERFAG